MANSSRAELLLAIKSSSKGESCPVTQGSAQALEESGSPPKTTMDDPGQVTPCLLATWEKQASCYPTEIQRWVEKGNGSCMYT